MGCSSSKLDHLEDSLHVMLSHDTRTKVGTGVPHRHDAPLYRCESTATMPEDLEDASFFSRSRHHHVGIVSIVEQ